MTGTLEILTICKHFNGNNNRNRKEQIHEIYPGLFERNTNNGQNRIFYSLANNKWCELYQKMGPDLNSIE